MIPYGRSAILSGYVEVAQSVGLNPYQMARQVGLDPACLTESELKVPIRLVRQLLEESARQSQVENFGLRMAKTRRLSVLGYLGLAARDAPTMRHLLGFLLQHMRMHNEALHMHMEDSGDKCIIRKDALHEPQGPSRQAVELVLGAMVRFTQIYLGDDWSPRSVCFVHDRPDDVSLHRQMFGHGLEFGAEFDGFICTNAELDAVLPSSDPVMARYTASLWQKIRDPEERSIEREVRQLIAILLPDGRCSVERVAKHLGVARQTIHRKLASEGQTFAALTAEIRQQLSDRYLAQSNRPLAQVALLLGFSELSGYSRWHRNLLGESPSARKLRLQRGGKDIGPNPSRRN